MTSEQALREALDQVSKLQAFKDYVHERLDKAGIPKEPGGQHSAAGCRVGDRLDIALAQQPAAVDGEDCPHSEIGGCDICATQPGEE